jgi:DNA-binding CsgD family transcriptional regulator
MEPVDQFISRLYRSTQHIDLSQFRHWALNALQTLIDFDAAIWSSGHLSTRTFHTHTTIGLPQSFPDTLIKFLPINPISKPLFTNIGEPVDMSDVMNDEDFFSSELYKQVFQPYGIKRILSSVHIDKRSGIYTLLTLYRKDHTNRFNPPERECYQRALYHMLSASSQACFINLTAVDQDKIAHAAICDKHGIYHEVESNFLDLMEEHFFERTNQTLPFPVPEAGKKITINQLSITTQSLGDLYRITVRLMTPLDELTARELEVVEGVTQGLSFKQIAKELSLSPSTISNHLYRIYQKLKITNRSELADLMRNQTQTVRSHIY